MKKILFVIIPLLFATSAYADGVCPDNKISSDPTSLLNWCHAVASSSSDCNSIHAPAQKSQCKNKLANACVERCKK